MLTIRMVIVNELCWHFVRAIIRRNTNSRHSITVPLLSFFHLFLCSLHCRVTAVAFNAFHDQLVLSGGADGRVNLWRASSVSSAPLLELGDDEIFTSSGGVDGSAGGAAAGAGASAGGGGSSGPAAARRSEPKMASDAAIRAHEEHEDSVYSVAWSAASAWVYASLSYQGRLTVAQVPSAEKYKILL